MKFILPFVLLIAGALISRAQVNTPGIRASFGVDGDLQCNFMNGLPGSGNDDWFRTPGGLGNFIIDTTGADAIVAAYLADPASRRIPFFRTQNYPSYYVEYGGSPRTYIDAVFIRDYHGADSTVFGNGSNKNGMSPADWACPVWQSVPDKNDILDMFIHIRRQGQSASDPLWLFGGLGLEGATGNRYFDFELYQTDIYYDRSTQKFYGYGPDMGHTSWQFDADGNVTVPGDIIFSAEYGSSTVTSIEARIWVHESALLTIPAGFDWSGTFEGAYSGAPYGYAGIRTKGNVVFYYGAENSASRFAGPYRLIRADESVQTNYLARQFMEFGVNLSVLGLDPVNLLGSNSCGLPFSRVLVKTRTSTSFSAELKDFVGPFDFFLPPPAEVTADIPVFCGSYGISQLAVVNPYPTSIYTWSTIDGHIAGGTTGININVDSPGTYIVTQLLQDGCPAYSNDTIVIAYDADCGLLANHQVSLKGVYNKGEVQLDWSVTKNNDIKNFQVERSTDGVHYTRIATINSTQGISQHAGYQYSDNVFKLNASNVYYRILVTAKDGTMQYSKVARVLLTADSQSQLTLLTNPVKDVLQFSIYMESDNSIQVLIYDMAGNLMKTATRHLPKGSSVVNIDGFRNWAKGIYTVKIYSGKTMFTERVLLAR
jgi:hypothetical protein